MSIRKPAVSPISQNLQDLENDLDSLKTLKPFEIPITSFTFNMIFPSDSRSIIFTTDSGIAVCNKSSLEVVKSSKVSTNPIISIAYSEHSSLLYLGDKKGNIHITNSKTLKVENIVQVFSSTIHKLILNFDEILLYMCVESSEVASLEINSLERKILYTHDGSPVRTMDLSNDGEFLLTGGEKLIKLYSIMKEAVVNQINTEVLVKCVKFNLENDGFAVGDDNGEIRLWNVEKWEEKVIKGHKAAVTRIVFAAGLMVSGSDDKTVRVWNTCGDSRALKILCSGGVTELGIDEQFLYYACPNHIYFMNLPKMPVELILQAHKREAGDLVYSSKKKVIFSGCSQEKWVKVWNADKIENCYFVRDLDNESNVFRICLSGDQLHIYVALVNKTIKKWSTEDFNSEVFVVSDALASYMICSPDNNYLITIDSSSRCIVRSTTDGSALFTFNHHKLSGISLAMTHLSNLLLTLGGDRNIFIYDLFEGKNIGKMEGIETEGYIMRVSYDDRLLAVTTIQSGVFIFSIEKQTMLHKISITTHKCIDLAFTQDNKFLIILAYDMNGSKYLYYSLQSFQLITSIFAEEYSTNFKLICDEKYIVANGGPNLYIKENPLKVENFTVVGPTTSYPDNFFKYIDDLVTGKSHDYNEEMNEYLILPSMTSVLHLYAYKNLSQHLEKALNSGASPFLSRSNLEIMRISLELGLVDSIRIILKHVTRSLKTNPYSACFLENSFTDLTKESHVELEEFYRALLFSPNDKSLPRFSSYPETFYKSEYLEINPKVMIPENGHGQSVKFLQSGIKISSDVGSSDSIAYLEGLLATGNNEIFRSQFVEVLLKEKWKEVRWFAEVYAAFYFFYLAILSLYTLKREDGFFYLLIVQNAVLVLYEVYQVGLVGIKYFSDGLNLVDLLRILFFVLFFGLDSKYGEILFLLNLVSWTRGVSHFRIFTSTRYLVNLIIEVIKDIGPFLTLLFYFTLGFTFMMLSLESSNQYNDFFKIEDIFMLNFGDFYISENSGSWQWVCFTISSLVNFLIMVNLLISIIGDTYDKVQAYRDIADRKEMTEIILEIEYLVVWKRSENSKKFIQFMCLDSLNNDEENWMGKVREIQEKMVSIDNSVKNQQIAMESRFDEVGKGMAEIMKNLDKIMKAQNIK